MALQRCELGCSADERETLGPARPPRPCLCPLWRGPEDQPDGPIFLRRLEGWVVQEDRPFQVLQRPSRVDTELLGEHPAGILVHVERVGLATAPVQRQHQLGTEPLPEGVLAHQLGQRPDDIAVTARCHLHIDQ